VTVVLKQQVAGKFLGCDPALRGDAPDVPLLRRMSMFLVPAQTPGVNILRNLAHLGQPEDAGTEALIEYDSVRVPAWEMLGEEGNAFGVAQVRLGGGPRAPRHADRGQRPTLPRHDGRARAVPG